MSTCVLFRCLVQAVVRHGDRLAEPAALGDVVDDAWGRWQEATRDDPRREEKGKAELQALATDPRALPADANRVLREETAALPAEQQRRVADYLRQTPSMVRRTLRRPSDPQGVSVYAGISLRRADDLLPFMPTRMPRFFAGARPLPGVDWELVELLGVGGFGEVWKAKNPRFDGVAPVALKFCLDPTVNRRELEHEAAVLNAVMRQGKNPGIVPLLRTYLDADPPCLEFEYIEGGDLAGLLRDKAGAGGGMDADLAARVVRQLAGVIGAAHRLNPAVVHRDLKPANVLVMRTPGGFTLRVADFGIGGLAATRAIEQSRRGSARPEVQASTLRGAYTPLYAPPQQMRGDPRDPRDDVYALGIIWYQLLLGDLGAGASADWRDELEERRVPGATADLLGRCLAAKAEKRPADAAALAEAMGGLAKAPGQALPPAKINSAVPVKAPARAEPAAGKVVANALGMKFAWVPPGTFLMGSPANEADRSDVETQHRVTLTRGFWMGVHQVTQAQWQAVMGTNPSAFKGDYLPVEQVSWDDAAQFCEALGKKDGQTYRLPTEAEWEYACRAGTTTPFHFGATISTEQVNHYNSRTTPVGSFPANGWGLHDTHGNVWEWCGDWYGGPFPSFDLTDPQGGNTGERRVRRGGSWNDLPFGCRAAFRDHGAPGVRHGTIGFRVVLRRPEDS
jgi:formylglycine-generating enzyme required for sulfatase activity